MKIRRIDFSPDEFLAGVSGMRVELIGLYWVVCSLIYSRGEPVANDAAWIARAAGIYRPSDCRRWLGQLIALGKLTVNAEGNLENGRAMVELGYAHARATRASAGGTASARARRSRPEVVSKSSRSRTQVDGVSAEINDLATTQPSTINHQPSQEKKEPPLPSGSVVKKDRRARSRSTAPKSINGGQHDDQRQRLRLGWQPSEAQREFARGEGLDPDAVADAFVVYWTEGKGRNERRSPDGWNRTWRGWCRRDGERAAGTASAHRPADRPARGGGLFGAALRLRSRDRG